MPTTCYIEILAVDRPFTFDVDDNDRQMWSLNLEAKSHGDVEEWEEDLVRIAQDAGVPLVLNTNAFIGSRSVLPPDDGPLVTVIDSGGIAPEETHDGSRFENLSAQIVTRGKDFVSTRERALAVWRALDGTRNVTVVA